MGIGRGFLLWILGVPLPVILLLALFWRQLRKNRDRYLPAYRRPIMSLPPVKLLTDPPTASKDNAVSLTALV
jgi:hypothetical protein